MSVVAAMLSKGSDWVREFLRDAPFRPREDTLTEVLLTHWSANGGARIVVRKATQREESAEGHDWAWVLQTRAGWAHMRVQAKNISRTPVGKYPELDKTDAIIQADKLILAASAAHALPVYVFYNSEADPFGAPGNFVDFGACARRRLSRDSHGAGFPWSAGTSPMGVTIAHADDIRTNAINAPTDSSAANVNTQAMPWECFFCPTWSNGSEAGNTRQIAVAAEHLRAQQRRQRSNDALSLTPPAWLTPQPPEWAALLLDGQDGDLPSNRDEFAGVGYFVVMRNVDTD